MLCSAFKQQKAHCGGIQTPKGPQGEGENCWSPAALLSTHAMEDPQSPSLTPEVLQTEAAWQGNPPLRRRAFLPQDCVLMAPGKPTGKRHAHGQSAEGRWRVASGMRWGLWGKTVFLPG